MIEIFIVHSTVIGDVRGRIRFRAVPESIPDITPGKEGAMGNEGTLILHSHRKAVNMVVARLANDEDTTGRVTCHFPVQAT